MVEIASVLCSVIVPVDLQHKLEVQVFPVMCWVDIVRVYSFPRFILYSGKYTMSHDARKHVLKDLNKV